jgi:hypothetical protein
MYHVPEITIEFDTIKAKIQQTTSKIVKVSNSSDYLNELLGLESYLKNSRFKFRITAKSTQELIMLDRRCVWGIDCVGVMHNLQRREEFKSKCLKPVKITRGKYIWFKNITYPFEMPFSIKNIEEDILYYWFKLLYIDNTWEIYKINTEYDGNITECL